MIVPQVVRVERVLDVVLAHPGREVQRRAHGRSREVRCSFDEDLGHGRARGPITCTFRVFQTRDKRGVLLIAPFDVTVVARHAAFVSRRDQHGWVTYSHGRSLRLVARQAIRS